MIEYFVLRRFRGTCLSVELLKVYMLICWNAGGVYGKRKVGNPWFSETKIGAEMCWSVWVCYCAVVVKRCFFLSLKTTSDCGLASVYADDIVLNSTFYLMLIIVSLSDFISLSRFDGQGPIRSHRPQGNHLHQQNQREIAHSSFVYFVIVWTSPNAALFSDFVPVFLQTDVEPLIRSATSRFFSFVAGDVFWLDRLCPAAWCSGRAPKDRPRSIVPRHKKRDRRVPLLFH